MQVGVVWHQVLKADEHWGALGALLPCTPSLLPPEKTSSLCAPWPLRSAGWSRACGAGWSGDSLQRCGHNLGKTLTSPSPGTQLGGPAAGEPASQALFLGRDGWRSSKAFWLGKLRHEPDSELVQSCPH